MNILERQIIWETFRIHFPMLICALWVINEQKKIIWNTLKEWWSWKDLKIWTKESKVFLFAVGLFIFCLFTANWRAKLVEKQQQQTVEKMLEEKVVTEEHIKKSSSRESNKKITNKTSLPLYNVSPFLCFILVCIVAPLGEECVFRYLVF